MSKLRTLPDGEVAEFPDSMSDADIDAVITRYSTMAPQGGAPGARPQAASPAPTAPPTQSGLVHQLLLPLSGLASGAAKLLGLPGSLEAAGRARSGATGVLGPAMFDTWLPSPLPTSGQLLGATNKLGITGPQGMATPQNPGEGYEYAAAEGVAPGLASILLGGAPIGSLLSGTLGSLGGHAGSQAFPGSKIAPIIGGLAGGAAGGGLASLVSGGPEELAATLGESSSLQEAGTKLQDAAKGWIHDELPGRLEATWSPVDAKVPASAKLDLTNFDSALESMNSKGGNLQSVLDLLTPRLPRQIAKELAPRASGLLDADGNPIMTPGIASSTWANGRTLRSAIGDAMGNPKVLNDIPQAQLSNLYRALTADLGATASASGAGDEWAAANAESTRLYGLAEGPIGGLLRTAGGREIAPEDAANALLRGASRGDTTLGALRSELPDAVDELAAAHLRTAPGRFAKLAPEAQASLIPDEGTRASAARVGVPSLPRTTEPYTKALLSAVTAHDMFPGGSNLLSPWMIDALGLAAPSILRAGANALRDPASLGNPLLGGVAGGLQAGGPLAPQRTNQ